MHENSSFSVYERMYRRIYNIELTFAGLDTLEPSVIRVSVAGTSTIFKPSTVRSATTDSARFLERAALWTRYLIADD